MENSVSTNFKDVKRVRLLIILLSLTDHEILRQSGFTDHEINITKNLALEKLHTQTVLKCYGAVKFLDSYFLFNK